MKVSPQLSPPVVPLALPGMSCPGLREALQDHLGSATEKSIRLQKAAPKGSNADLFNGTSNLGLLMGSPQPGSPQWSIRPLLAATWEAC